MWTDDKKDGDDNVNRRQGWAGAGNDEDRPGQTMMKRKAGEAGNEERDDKDNEKKGRSRRGW